MNYDVNYDGVYIYIYVSGAAGIALVVLGTAEMVTLDERPPSIDVNYDGLYHFDEL